MAISATSAGEYVTLAQLAKRLGMDRSAARKYALKAGHVFSRARHPDNHQLVNALPRLEADQLLSFRQSQGFSLVAESEAKPRGLYERVSDALVEDFDQSDEVIARAVIAEAEELPREEFIELMVLALTRIVADRRRTVRRELTETTFSRNAIRAQPERENVHSISEPQAPFDTSHARAVEPNKEAPFGLLSTPAPGHRDDAHILAEPQKNDGLPHVQAVKSTAGTIPEGLPTSQSERERAIQRRDASHSSLDTPRAQAALLSGPILAGRKPSKAVLALLGLDPDDDDAPPIEKRRRWLNGRIYIPGHGHPLVGEATAPQHRERVKYLQTMRAAYNRTMEFTADLHGAAAEEIERNDAECLFDLYPEFRA